MLILSYVHLGQLALLEDHETGSVLHKGHGFLDAYRNVTSGLKVVRFDEFDDSEFMSVDWERRRVKRLCQTDTRRQFRTKLYR